MNIYLVDPSGKIEKIEINSQKEVREWLKKGYRKATPNERIAFLKEEKEKVLQHIADANLLDVFFLCPKSGKNDGYSTSSNLLARECERHGVFLNRIYTGQKVGLVYNYPYALEAMQCDHKVLFTMFESTKMPSDWDKYLKMADEVIVPSKFCQRVMKSQFGIDAKIINLGYDERNYKYIERVRNDKFTFLHYDAFKWRKGWDIVLTAFDQEFDEKDEVRLILKSVKSDITPPVSAYNNVEKITEALSGEDMMRLMARSDCFVFPSRGEGFGLTPLEAMATGMPAIAPNAHGIAEYWDWEIMPNLEIMPIKARYDSERFYGMDLGAMFQPTVRSVRDAMRKEYLLWRTNKDLWWERTQRASEHAKGWTVQKTGEKLAHLLLNSYKRASEDRSKKIVYFSEDIRHITGGRYYSWWLATALKANGFDVEIYTNKMPVFLNEFKSYPQPTVYLVDNLAEVDVKAMAYFGSPVTGNMRACQLAEKYGKQAYCEIFDPFPMMAKYRGKHSYPEWERLIPELKKDHVKILALCNETKKWVYPWLNKKKSEVFTVYPCINSHERDNSPAVMEKKNWAVFVSRLDNHKRLPHVLEAVKATDLELHIITSVDGIDFPSLLKEYDMEDRVKIHWFASDKEKFEIIKQSKVMINGAIFEGFGMWLAESLACGVPCVCYNYPTFHEIAGEDNELVIYADWDNSADLKDKLKFALSIANNPAEKPNWKPTNRFDFEAMVATFDQIMHREPKIGVITICLNEENFIFPSITSVLKHPNIAKIAVVEGLVEQNEHTPNKGGLSADGTKNEVLRAIEQDDEGKIIYDRYGLAGNKSELRNRGLELVGKDMDYILVVDGDECWKHEDLDKLIKYAQSYPKATVLYPKFLHFWKSPNLIAVDGQWEAKLFRFFRYEDKSLHWELHETPVVNKDGILIDALGDEEDLEDVHVYHYGYMKPAERIKEKLLYYKKRDNDLDVVDTFTDWKEGDKTSPTHGSGTVSRFDGEHPEAVRLALASMSEQA